MAGLSFSQVGSLTKPMATRAYAGVLALDGGVKRPCWLIGRFSGEFQAKQTPLERMTYLLDYRFENSSNREQIDGT